MVKNLETQVPSLGGEDPEMPTHSSILACRIPWTEEPGRLQSMGLQRVGQDRATNTHTHTPHLVGRQRFGTQGSLGVPMLAVALGQGLDP